MDYSVFSISVLLIAFIWSGFVRAGLGFGGAGLMYPIAFLAIDSVIYIVPIVGVQLLFFSSITLALGGYKQIDWKTTGILILVMLPTYLIGVFGLLQMSAFWLLMIVYGVLMLYSLGYILSYSVKPKLWLNGPVLLFGSYISGLSLSGAPVVAAVAMQYLTKEQARASMFVIWIFMVVIKLATLHSFDVDLQLQDQLWLFPAAAIGHLIGLKFHDRLLELQDEGFYRWMGVGLLAISLIGLVRHIGSAM